MPMIVDVIAPGYGGATEDIEKVARYLESLGLTPRIPADLFGADLLHAQSDAVRSQHLVDALQNDESQAIWCFKGGYGTAKCLPALQKMPKPRRQKWLVGFSDITALHLFLQQEWGWPTLHAPVLWQLIHGKVEAGCGEAVRDFLHNAAPQQFALTALNKAAQHYTGEASLTGGNLALLQTSLGTFWQLQSTKRFLLIEEVDEAAYRVDRMLQHLQQAAQFDKVEAVLLGDFLDRTSEAAQAKVEAVLQGFAAALHKPVFRVDGIGHGETNRPMPFGRIGHIANGKLVV